MAINYQDVLPDPNNPIGSAGQNTGTAGPGYASVQLVSKSPILKTRTNSGRTIARALVAHSWEISIGYNPMTRLEFEPVYNFLLNRSGGLKPFKVSLPQYRVPQDSTFATYAALDSDTNDILDNLIRVKNTGAVPAGATEFLIDGLSGASGSPSPGDLFTITDPADFNHTKTYRVTEVENNSVYSTAQPAADQRIVHFIPGLQRQTGDNSILNFHNPLIRVILSSDVQEYSLGTNGLYTFSLKLQEAQS